MGENLTRQLLRDHLVEGELMPGTPIALRVDQTLLQDATGTIARIHRRNLVAQGILALTFAEEDDYELARVGDTWTLPEVRRGLEEGAEQISARIEESGRELSLVHDFAPKERQILLSGGLLSYLRGEQAVA